MINPPTNKQWALILFGGLAAIILIIVLVILGRTPSKKLFLADSGIVIKHSLAVADNDDSIYFNTNRNLVKYNPLTGSSTLLMNDGLLPEITQIIVSPDKKRALFSTAGTTENDQLRQIFEEDGTATTETIWWLADFSKKEYTPYGTNIKQAGWLDSDNIFIVGRPSLSDKGGLYKKELSSPGFTAIYTSDSLANAYPYSNGFLLYSASNGQGKLLRLATSSKEPQTIKEKLSRAPFVSPNGNYAVIMKDVTGGKPDDGDLNEDDMQLLNTASGKLVKQLASKQTNDGYWSADGNSFYFESNQKRAFMMAAVKNGKVQLSTIKIGDGKTSLSKFLITTNHNLYILDTNDRLSVGSFVPLPALKTKLNSPIGPNGYSGDGFKIFFYPSTNTYGIELGDNPSDPYKSKALEFMRKSGSNPDLVDIVYDYEHSLEDANTSVPVPETIGD